MHVLQPKHSRLKEDEAYKLLQKYNISKSQLPKISIDEPTIPEGCKVGDIIKIERKDGEETFVYYRVVL